MPRGLQGFLRPQSLWSDEVEMSSLGDRFCLNDGSVRSVYVIVEAEVYLYALLTRLREYPSY